MPAPRLFKAMNVPLQRQYPVLIGYEFARKGGSSDVHECQRGGCSLPARYARVWLSPTELGRYSLTGLRHGVYYCSEHTHEVRDSTGVPILESVEQMSAYQAAVIAECNPDRTAAPDDARLAAAEAPKVIIARGQNGVILKCHDGRLEVLPDQGDAIEVCCRRKARTVAGEPDPVASAREHSRDCPKNAQLG